MGKSKKDLKRIARAMEHTRFASWYEEGDTLPDKVAALVLKYDDQRWELAVLGSIHKTQIRKSIAQWMRGQVALMEPAEETKLVLLTWADYIEAGRYETTLSAADYDKLVGLIQEGEDETG